MNDHDDAEFERLVSMHLPTILHVSTLLTSDDPLAEDLAVDALLQVSRRRFNAANWQREVYAAVIRGYRRRRHRPEQRARGTLELQDFRPGSATAGMAAPSRDSIIRAELRSLSDPERSALVLHCVAALDVDQIARVLRRPRRWVRRDLARAMDFLADASGALPGLAEPRIRQALKPPSPERSESNPTQARLRTRVATAATPPHRPHPVVIGVAALATAAVVIAAFTIGRSGEGQPEATDTTDPAPSTRSPTAPPELPRTASGLILVGYEQIMVTIPQAWTEVVSQKSGGRVDFGLYGSVPSDGVTLHRQSTSVGGEPLLLSTITRADGRFLQYGALADANVAIAVTARKRADLAMVLSSIQEVPATYVVVPDCVGLDAEEASDLLTGAGLNGRIFADPSSAAAGLMLRVVTQAPGIGSVLPFDATVNLGAVPR